MFVKSADFIGGYKISTDNFSQLDNYITQFEPKYLKNILGDDNYASMIAAPDQQKYVDLLAEGLKEALLGFIYFHFVSDNFLNTTVGNTFNNNENSTKVGNGVNAQITINRYNTAVDLVNTNVYDFVYDNTDKSVAVLSSSYSGGIYTCQVDSADFTDYLDIGLAVNIEGVKYIVTNVIDGISFSFEANSGLDFTKKIATWKPFYNVTVNKFKEIVI